MNTLIERLTKCYKDPHQPGIDGPTSHGLELLNKCLVILSNLSARNPDARKEILKFKLLNMVADIFDLPLVQQSL